MSVTDRLAALAPQQRALFEKLLEKQREATHAHQPAPPILPVPREGDPLLSFAQERLWFVDQLKPDNAAYNLPVALRVSGPLDAAALKAALDETARRHEVLRTTFAPTSGRPVQRIAAPAPVHLAQVDLTNLPASRRARRALRIIREEGRRAFDLLRGPLLRSLLVRLQGREHLLLLNMHHIVSDAWSTGVLVRELTSLYGSFVKGRPSPLAELPIQYSDFAAWQRQWLQGEILEAELSYWRERLSGAHTVLELPMDRPRPAVQTLAGASFPFALPAELSMRLQAASQRLGATLFMVLLAVFQELLGRASSQSDLTVGTPVAGRTDRQTEELIGFFINMLVLRTDLSGEPSFATLVRRLRETLLSAYEHQDLPFEMLVEELQRERSLSHTPLFQVVLALNPPVQALDVEGLLFETVPLETGTAKFDLTVSMQETGDGLSGVAEYNTDLFDRVTVERLVGHWQVLLAGVVSAPERPLPKLEWLTPEERQQVLLEWSGEETSYPREATIHALFVEQAALTPDAVAVVGAGESLCYGELERRAGRWARRLCALGVGPEVRVGICLDRSPARVVMTLAVLMAGGAYIPLDPTYPRERLAFLVRDSGASVLVTEERWLPALPQTGAAVLCLDRNDPWEESFVEPGGVLQVPAAALAYVMYTSGSTGEPKGVAVTHRSVVRLVRETSYARFGPDEVFLQIAPYAFDASTLELWGALLNGGRLVMPSAGVLSPADLGEILRDHGVTTLWLTAGLFHQMVDENLQGLAGVRQLLAGGDVLSVPHVRRVLAELPGTRLINGYGPTENTTFTCCYPVVAPAELEPSVPLGRPIANTWIYVLDHHLALVPVGVAGELYTGGDGLARGYLARPERTAERFLPDPFGGTPGGRLYRTGDLVRWRAEGELEFLGRTDHQVKVRGFRVEPGEIEAALAEHPGVRQAVIAVRGDLPGGRGLVAFVVPDGGPEPAVAELRQLLRERLPEFMVPGHFAFLDRLPVTASGKVDRQALSRLRVFPNNEDRVEAAPAPGRSPAEELMTGIFAELLQAERVAPDESFFNLGGHSLLATQLVSRLRLVFGVELPVRTVFEAPTVAGLAAAMERALRAGEEARIPPLARVARDGPLPLSFAQQRLWFIDQLKPGSPLYNISAALRIEGALEARVLALCLGEIVRRHEALRTVFAAPKGSPVQDIRPVAPFELNLVDLSGLPESTREASALVLAREEARRPFDLTRGPLLRGGLLRLAEGEHVALLTMHHIASDGWSIGVLIREVAPLYAAFARGLPSPMPELPVQYVDFAVWQRSWLQGRILEAQLEHWRRLLAGAPALLELPLDRPRPAVQTFRGASRPLQIDPGLSDAVRGLCRREGVTPFMVLLAAWAVLLGRYAGQEDVLVGVPIAGRNRKEIEDLIGFFVNTLVLRSDLSKNPSFGELLSRVRRTALDVFAHQDSPSSGSSRRLQSSGIWRSLRSSRCSSLCRMPRWETWKCRGWWSRRSTSTQALRSSISL